MAHGIIATLGGTELPLNFSYRVYVPRKRNSVTVTANAVVTQASAPTQIVHGDTTIAWTIEGAFPTEFTLMRDFYNTALLDLIVFNGYWEDSYEVFFRTFDQPQPRGRIFNLSGMFQIIDVLSPPVPECNP